MIEYTFEITNTPDDFMDMLVTHPYQTSVYGKFYSKQHACTQLSMRIKQDSKVVAQLLYFLKGKGSETLSGFPMGKWINKLTQFALPEIVWYQGPQFFGDVNRDEVTRFIIDTLNEQHNVYRITADLPYLYVGEKWATYKIDLSKSEDALLKGINKSARKNIKKVEEQVVVSFVNDKKGIKEYLGLLKESRKHLGFVYLPPVHINEWLVNCFGDHAQICMVKDKTGKPLAAMGLVLWGENCIEVGSAISPSCRERKLYCGDLIKWKIMQYAKMRGMRYYDLGGCSPKPVNDKEKDIRRFKEKFGGEYFEYGVLR